MGLEWVVFPPSPFPNPIWTYTCMPEPKADWDVGLDLPLCPPQAEQAGGVVKERCQSFESLKKESTGEYLQRKMSGVASYPVSFFNQMLACVGCSFCQIGGMIEAQWNRLAKIIARLLRRLDRQVSAVVGYSHAGPSEIVRQHAAIRRIMKAGLSSSGSLLEVGSEAIHAAWNSSDAVIEESLRQVLERHSSDPATQRERLSLIQASMDELGSSGGLHRLLLEAQLNQTDSLWRRKMQQVQPALQTDVCQEAFYRRQDDWTVDFSLNVEFPDLGEALLNAMLGNPVGVLQALIPEVLLMAIPRSNLQFRQKPVNDCLKLVESEFHYEMCFDERPFLACTTLTLQRVLTMAMKGRWWPMGNVLDEHYSDTVRRLVSATAGTCLEYHASEQTKHRPDEAWLDEKLENPDEKSGAVFDGRHCPIVKTTVDAALKDDNGLPTNDAYAIWVAAVLHQGPHAAKECPDFTPFVAGFCAEQLGCTEHTVLVEGAPFPGSTAGEEPAPSDAGQAQLLAHAVDFVKGLSAQKTPAKEQWGQLWRAVKWAGDKTPMKLAWRDMRGMVRDGSSTDGLHQAAVFWSATHQYILDAASRRESKASDFTEWPETRKFFGMPSTFARMDDTWRKLVKEYQGGSWGGQPMCDALRVPDAATRKKVADGEEGYAVLGAGLTCCCWGKGACTEPQLDEENAKGKGRVFNLRPGPPDGTRCCRLQERSTCGKLGGLLGGRFAEEATDMGACIKAAWG